MNIYPDDSFEDFTHVQIFDPFGAHVLDMV